MSKAKSTPQPGFIRGAEHETGDTFVPDVRRPVAEQPPTRVDACPPYMLAWHPERWTVCGDEVVPCFGRVIVAAGVNGASDLGGKLDIGEPRIAAEARGYRPIPFDAVPPCDVRDPARPSYLYRPRGRPDVHMLIYERCYPGSKVIERDEEGFLRFCAHLRALGLVQPPAAYVLRKLLARVQHERDDLAARAEEHPSYRASLRVAEHHVDVVEAALAAAGHGAPSEAAEAVTL